MICTHVFFFEENALNTAKIVKSSFSIPVLQFFLLESTSNKEENSNLNNPIISFDCMPVGRVGGVSVEAVANAHVARTLHSS